MDAGTGFLDSTRGLIRVEESSQQTPAALILSMLHAQIEALAGSESLREIRRWELIEQNEVTEQLAQRREKAARSFIDRVDGLTQELDVPQWSASCWRGCCI
ncbi:hypothetical protein [Advenella kashmirensis]|uniref:hypothetical protein n=1 Tax=Advenella kashmirensis TaxID=310575 RepID=UPI00267FCE54|nr:hypothetical protein [Advenella kashmirensis]